MREVKNFTKKPVVIEAIQWNGLNLVEVKSFVGDACKYDYYDAGYQAGVVPPSVDLFIHTLEGDMKCSKGDYIIKGVQGEFYPCKPDIFKQTYDELKEE